MRVVSSVTINRPLHEVFAFTTDFENATKWRPEAVEYKRTSQGPIGKGTTYRYTERVMPMVKMAGTFVVTDYQPNKSMSFEGPPVSGVKPHGAYEFKQAGQGTEVTFILTPEAKGLTKLMSPLLSFQIRRIAKRNQGILKRVLESSKS